MIYSPEAFGVILDESWAREIMYHGNAYAAFVAISNGALSAPKDTYLAQRLVEQRYEQLVLAHLDEFEGGKNDIACALARTNRDGSIENLRRTLDRYSGFSDEECRELSNALGAPFREFPYSDDPAVAAKLRARQARWLCEYMYQDMGSGWPKRKLGDLLAIRLHHMPGENDLHDVSQWLSEFVVPQTGYDTTTMRTLKAAYPTTSIEGARVTYFNPELEEALLRQLYQSGSNLRGRLALPLKDEKLALMFSDPAHRFVYELLAENIGNDALFGKDIGHIDQLEPSELWALAQVRFDDFYAWHADPYGPGELTAERIPKDRIWNRTQAILMHLTDEPLTDNGITATVATLQSYGRNRQAYINDTMAWLMRHASTPNELLTKVWCDRPRAIGCGIEDSVREILAWQDEQAFMEIMDRAEGDILPNGITRGELLHPRWIPWRRELSTVLSAETTIEAISLANGWLALHGNAPKLLPAGVIHVASSRDSTRSYSFEVLGEDDPRGFTIGPKTGCCLRLCGAAGSCIEAGYSMPNAGFVALSTPDDDLAAQSFWYINPLQPDTLVLDNIETNEGRDMGNVLQLYTDALTSYLRQHPELGITKVHVGEGYSDVPLAHLPSVEPVPSMDGVYTDARSQRSLLSLVPEAR